MIKEESILDEVTGEKFASNALTSRFKNLAGKFCAADFQAPTEFIHKFKDATRFYKLPLPVKMNEYFIRFEEASLFLLYESTYTFNYENYFREFNDKKFPGDTHRSLMEFYVKWATLKSMSDKKFFANSMINIITKNLSPEYFLSRMIYAILLIYDQFFYNPFQAREVLQEVEVSLDQSRLDSDKKNEFRYLIKLYTGFSYLTQRDPLTASQIFAEAVHLNNNGITAQFYLALTSLQKNDIESASEQIKLLFLFDVERLKFAVDCSNLPMFQYFLKFPVCSNLFRYDDFAPVYRTIEEIIEDNRKRDEISLDTLRNKLIFLSQLKLNKFYDEEIISSLFFLESVTQKYTGSTPTLFNAVLHKFSDRMITIVRGIEKNITQSYNSEITERLSGYDNKIDIHTNNIAILKQEFDELKAQAKQKLDSSISIIESNAALNISRTEEEINLMNNNSKLNPLLSFKTSMVYNIIASVLVFLVGGIAGYTNIEYSVGSEFNDLLSGVIFQGLKWTVITFLIGSLISMAMAGFVFMDRSNYKHKLIKRISAIKNDKERQLSELRERSKNRDKLLQDSLKENIEKENNSISKLKKDIEELTKSLTEEVNKKIAEEVKRLEPLLLS